MKDTQPEDNPSRNSLSSSPDWRKPASLQHGLESTNSLLSTCLYTAETSFGHSAPQLSLCLLCKMMHETPAVGSNRLPLWALSFQLTSVCLSFLLPPYPYLALKDLKCVFTSGLVRQSPTYQGSNWAMYLFLVPFRAHQASLLWNSADVIFFFLLLVLGATGCSRAKWPEKWNDMIVFC